MSRSSHYIGLDNDALIALIELQQEVAVSNLAPNDLMHLVATSAQRLTNADGATVELLDSEEVVCAAASGSEGDALGDRWSAEEGLAGWALKTGEAQLCSHAAMDPRVSPKEWRDKDMRAILVAPVRCLGSNDVLLRVTSARPRAFNGGHTQILRLMGGLVGAAIGRIRLVEGTMAAQNAALAERSARLNLALDAGHLTCWEYDFETECMTRSESYKRMTGMDAVPDTPESKRIRYDLIHPDDRNRFREALERAKEGEDRFFCEYRGFAKDKMIWVVNQGTVVRDMDGKAVRIVGVALDVTPEREAQARLTALEAEQRETHIREQAARQASKLKSAFLASVSHELRNPLHGIIGMVEMLATTKLDHQQTECMDHLRRSSSLLLSLTNDLLDLSKAEAGKISLESKAFDLHQVVREAAAPAGLACEKNGLQFGVSFSPTVPRRMRGDPTRLAQLVLNLTNNAVKFTQYGRVDVRCFGVAMEDGRCNVSIEVEDTGIGIEESVQASLFEPFTQADTSITRRFGGTGLGLSICKHLVELMGGHIGLRSRPKAGSVFWFSIPLPLATDDDQDEELPARKSNGVARVLKRLRVLVADDDHTSSMLATRMLQAMGHSVTVAETGQAALAACKTETFDLVLMHGEMPDHTGIEAAQMIRDQIEGGETLPIIAVTGQTDAQRFLDAGMDAYVAKPMTAHDLREAIERTLHIRSSGRS